MRGIGNLQILERQWRLGLGTGKRASAVPCTAKAPSPARFAHQQQHLCTSGATGTDADGGRLPPLVCPSASPQTPWLDLLETRRYTFCVSARLGPGSPASVATRLDAIYQWNPTTLLAFNYVTLTATWQRVCLRDYRPNKGIGTYFALYVGFAAATYDFDDAALTHVAADAVPEGTYAPAKVNAFFSTFETIGVPFTNKFVLHNQPVISQLGDFSVAVTNMDGAGSVRAASPRAA